MALALFLISFSPTYVYLLFNSLSLSLFPPFFLSSGEVRAFLCPSHFYLFSPTYVYLLFNSLSLSILPSFFVSSGEVRAFLCPSLFYLFSPTYVYLLFNSLSLSLSLFSPPSSSLQVRPECCSVSPFSFIYLSDTYFKILLQLSLFSPRSLTHL